MASSQFHRTHIRNLERAQLIQRLWRSGGRKGSGTSSVRRMQRERERFLEAYVCMQNRACKLLPRASASKSDREYPVDQRTSGWGGHLCPTAVCSALMALEKSKNLGEREGGREREDEGSKSKHDKQVVDMQSPQRAAATATTTTTTTTRYLQPARIFFGAYRGSLFTTNEARHRKKAQSKIKENGQQGGSSRRQKKTRDEEVFLPVGAKPTDLRWEPRFRRAARARAQSNNKSKRMKKKHKNDTNNKNQQESE